jgi:hypothetical protein
VSDDDNKADNKADNEAGNHSLHLCRQCNGTGYVKSPQRADYRDTEEMDPHEFNALVREAVRSTPPRPSPMPPTSTPEAPPVLPTRVAAAIAFAPCCRHRGDSHVGVRARAFALIPTQGVWFGHAQRRRLRGEDEFVPQPGHRAWRCAWTRKAYSQEVSTYFQITRIRTYFKEVFGSR